MTDVDDDEDFADPEEGDDDHTPDIPVDDDPGVDQGDGGENAPGEDDFADPGVDDPDGIG